MEAVAISLVLSMFSAIPDPRAANARHRLVDVLAVSPLAMLVTACCVDDAVELCQTAVDEKSMDITAVPKLLDMMDPNGAVVTVDALNTQKALPRFVTRLNRVRLSLRLAPSPSGASRVGSVRQHARSAAWRTGHSKAISFQLARQNRFH
jgi:predicted transposase YbfD/YdcC